MRAENFRRKLMARQQFKPRVNICRNEDGSLISNEQEMFKIWVRHFDTLLTLSPP